MILPLVQLLTLLAVLLAVYWLIPARYQLARQAFLILASLALLFTLSPVLAGVAALYAALVALLGYGLRNALITPAMARRLSWVSFVGLAGPELLSSGEFTQLVMGDTVDPQSRVAAIAWLGLGLLTIRAFVAVRDLAAMNGRGLSATLCSLLFFASYPAGPVARARHFAGGAGRLTIGAMITAVARLGWGVAMISVLAPFIAAYSWAAPTAFIGAWVGAYQHFLTLFANFAGATHVAIAIGLLFGLKLPENFRAPLLATSVAEFWGRWHMSFMDIVRTFFTAPLVRQTGNRKLALLVVFPLVGLWHHVTPQYFLWGVGHALALIAYAQMRQSPAFERARVRHRIALGVAGWAFTLSYVSALSAIANTPDWPAAMRMIDALTVGAL
jgi:alginate O-acetyltransferase complex protein AlgI